MEFSRNERIAEEIKKGISEIIGTNLKDPRVKGLVSITRVKVTKDLSHATIFLSFYCDEIEKEAAFDAIQSAKGFIKRELASKIRIKYMPDISFKIDESIEYGIHISKVLEEIKQQEQGKKKENGDEEN